MEVCRIVNVTRLLGSLAGMACCAGFAAAQPATAPGALPPVADTPATQPAPGSHTPASVEPTAASTADETGWLRVTASSLNVRSRPDTNSTPVTRVNRDAVLYYVGREHGWYAIVPPADVFCVVAREFVHRDSDIRGTVNVKDGTLRVRVGTRLLTLDPMIADRVALLPKGAAVEIVGEQGDWLMIKPPPGVFSYVSEDYVERIGDEQARSLGAGERPTVALRHIAAPPAAGETHTPTTLAAADLTGDWGKRLTDIETAIGAEAEKPPLEQSWDPILARLAPIVQQREEPQIASYAGEWSLRIERRKADQAALREARGAASRDERDRAQHAGELERIDRAREEAARRRIDFDAMGLLRPSFAVPAGEFGLRYKLLDPVTQKVRAYVEIPTNLNLELKNFNGKYVGVIGEKIVTEELGAPFYRVERMVVLGTSQPVAPARESP